jgi:hypothetical protein
MDRMVVLSREVVARIDRDHFPTTWTKLGDACINLAEFP